MATDDERRRVAAALREYASFDCEDEGEEECLVDCTDWGERVLNLLGCGDTEDECYAALADLIDPSCDREALLALAEDVTEAAAMATAVDASKSAEMLAEMLLDIARRIREALGVQDA